MIRQPPDRPSQPGEKALFAPGEMIDQAYQLSRLLGEGGTGQVWLAKDLRLSRDVAIKVLRHGLLENHPKRFNALTNEGRAMAAIRHPNVVAIYAAGSHHERPYLVMEFMAGGSLLAWLGASAGLRPARAVHAIEQIAAGAEAIHSAGAVHLDIKLGNVMVADGFRLALADFGLAQLLTQDDATVMGGTPVYMAPELFLTEQLSLPSMRSADIYALGVLAYSLFTGKFPFSGSPAIMQRAHAKTKPSRPSSIANVPAALDEPMGRVLSKDPRDRFARPSDFARALREAFRESRRVKRVRVLLVDDDPFFCDFVVAILSNSLPYLAITAVHDGEEAKNALETVQPHLVITDLEMPRLDGMSLVKLILESPRASMMQLVVMTGTGGAQDWKTLEALGVDDFLLKPVREAQLVRTIRGLVEEKQSGSEWPEA